MDYFCFPSLKAIYVSIPKNACSTIKRSALVYEGDLADSENPRGDVHRLALKYCVSREDAQLLHDGPMGLTSFAILSDPLRRYISSYLDKFCLAFPNPEPYVKSFPVGANISFVQFMEYVSEAKPSLLNEHWCHQSHFIASGIRIDQFFWLNDMRQTLGLSIGRSVLPIMNVDHHSTSTIESPQDSSALSIFSTSSEIHEALKATHKLPSKRLFSAQLSESKDLIASSVFSHLSFESKYVEGLISPLPPSAI